MRFAAQIDDSLGAVTEQQSKSRLCVAPLVHDEVGLERFDADDPATGFVRDEFGPGCRVGPIGGGAGLQDSEVVGAT